MSVYVSPWEGRRVIGFHGGTLWGVVKVSSIMDV